MWAVLAVLTRDVLFDGTLMPWGIKPRVAPPEPGEPSAFIPLFDSREEADAWAEGRFVVWEFRTEKEEVTDHAK